MKKHRYYHEDISKNYFKTLITCASFFARNKEAADIFKNSNDDEDTQDVIYYYFNF